MEKEKKKLPKKEIIENVIRAASKIVCVVVPIVFAVILKRKGGKGGKGGIENPNNA